jgi:hypothetical protein
MRQVRGYKVVAGVRIASGHSTSEPICPCRDKIDLPLIGENSTRTITSETLGSFFFCCHFSEKSEKNSPARNPRRGA